MHKISRLSIIIPVFNEKQTLRSIVDSVKAVDLAHITKEYILVDDASTDGTREILKEMQQQDPSLKVYFKDKNSGKGATLREGFSYATGDYVIVQDADLEYDPNDYKKLVRAVEEEDVEVVYGSRFSGTYKDMSTLHYFGNKLLTLVTNLFFGVLLTDMETCYKLMPADFIKKIKIRSNRFNFEPEITAKILKSGLRIREVPISYHGRTRSQGKKITWKDGISALWTLIKYKFVD
ncbi:glycosyltransferase family 2 protein [Patescibacteria group bacterium]|nr:glycosyltransferase family 2 protein [Patescibacteria group bacterium]